MRRIGQSRGGCARIFEPLRVDEAAGAIGVAEAQRVEPEVCGQAAVQVRQRLAGREEQVLLRPVNLSDSV